MTSPDSKLPNDDDPQDLETLTNADKLRVTLEIVVAALILAVIYYLFAPEEEIDLAPPLQESQIDPIIRAQIDTSTKQNPIEQDTSSSEKVAPLDASPSQENSINEIEPVKTAITEGGSARELINRLRSGELSFNAEQLLEQATIHQNEGRLTDAYLLLFYAARKGNAAAAFSLASLHDPNHFTAGNQLLEKPNSYQAHKWYSAAADKGIAEATERLRTLKETTEEQAKQGDPAAMRLLLNWQ
jgi:TPR repeat protein